jgi:fatty-acyl-CoA synthase
MTESARPASSQPADRTRPVLETTVGGVLREAAERDAGALALIEGTANPVDRRRWTFDDLLADSERVARALLGRFDPGERVAVWAPNSPEWVLVELGAALAGLTLVTVDPALRAGELAHVLSQSGASGIVLAPAHRGNDLRATLADARDGLPNLREAISLADWDDFAGSGSPAERLPRVRPDDPAQIQYTSGATGLPKGAVLHHRGITNNARFWTEILLGGPGDVWVNPMPLFHTAGCVLLTLGPIQHGFTQVLPPGFDPGLVLHLIESERGTLLGGVPTMLLAQLEHPDFPGRDLSTVRCAMAGGATVPPAVVRRVESALDVPLSIVYAQTEASPSITQTRLDDSPTDRAETLGRPHPQVEVRIADPRTGETVPAGTVGAILTRGYHVMSGYFDDVAATAAAIDAGGWLRTGDLGSMDERGYCRIEGRLTEMIVRGGESTSTGASTSFRAYTGTERSNGSSANS